MLPPTFSAGSYQRDGFIFEHHRQPSFDALPQAFLTHAISIKLDGPSAVELRCDKKLTRQSLTQGDITLAPYRFTIDGGRVEACEFLQLCLKPSVVDHAAKELGVGNQIKLVPVLGVVDPLVELTIYQLEEELTSGVGRRDYVNVLIDTVATHLVRYYAESTWTRSNIGGFPKYVLDRTLDYIARNLERNLSVKEIAQAVGIEADRFARAFRVTTGKSIHCYLSERGISKSS